MLSQTHNDIPEKENEERHESLESEINSRNHNGNLSNAPVLKENTKENSINSSIHENHNSCNAMKHNERGETVTREITDAYKNDNRNKQFDIERTIIDKRGRLLCIESHSNGVVYEEYVFKLSIDREMKIKYPVSLNNSEEVVRLEFVDNETDYSVTSMDRMLILLKNIHAIVIVKQTGVSCSTQTTKTKTSNNFAQTAITGVNSFSRLNSGATVSKEISTFSTLNCTFRHWIYLLRTNITLLLIKNTKKIKFKFIIIHKRIIYMFYEYWFFYINTSFEYSISLIL